MKVHQLWVGEYRVLRDLALEFSPHLDTLQSAGDALSRYALDLVVGVNGTGKSTVLRALRDVFRQIENGTSSEDFRFRITYERKQGELITVTNADKENQALDGGFEIQVGKDGPVQTTHDAREFAPPLYVTYTTGREESWEDAADEKSDDTDDELWAEAISGPYWLREQPGTPPPEEEEQQQTEENTRIAPGNHVHVRADDLPLVTLCGLLEHGVDARAGVPEDLLVKAFRELGVQRLSAFSMRFHLPPGVGDRDDRERILALRGVASRTRMQGASLSFVFDLRERVAETRDAVLRALSVGNTLGLFQVLAGYSRPRPGYRPLLDRVDLFLERKHREDQGGSPPDLHTYDWLSDGERTFLGRMCMLALFGAADALILLDEPEVHFNDYWKRKLGRFLDQALGQHHSHVIVTTHSSIVLTDARPNQIVVLDRDTSGYTRTRLYVEVPTFAGDPSDVLVQIFGAEQASGAKSVEEVRDLLTEYEGMGRVGLITERRKELRARLVKLQGDLAPGYWRFRVRDALREESNAPPA